VWHILRCKAEEAGLDTPGIEDLTEEEKRVLDLLVRGTPARRSLPTLAISPEMVREHVQSIPEHPDESATRQ
jgi:DNA-binding NarL/FixJ family response regulator